MVITGVEVLADGRFLSYSGDGTLRLWYDNPQDFIDSACSVVYRDFTDDERRLFDIDDTPTCPKFASS